MTLRGCVLWSFAGILIETYCPGNDSTHRHRGSFNPPRSVKYCSDAIAGWPVQRRDDGGVTLARPFEVRTAEGLACVVMAHSLCAWSLPLLLWMALR